MLAMMKEEFVRIWNSQDVLLTKVITIQYNTREREVGKENSVI